MQKAEFNKMVLYGGQIREAMILKNKNLDDILKAMNPIEDIKGNVLGISMEVRNPKHLDFTELIKNYEIRGIHKINSIISFHIYPKQ